MKKYNNLPKQQQDYLKVLKTKNIFKFDDEERAFWQTHVCRFYQFLYQVYQNYFILEFWKIIQPILAESDSFYFSYSRELKSLFLALTERVQFNHELTTSFPIIKTLIIKLSKIVHDSQKFSEIGEIKKAKLRSQIFLKPNQKQINTLKNSKIQNQCLLSFSNIKKACYLDQIQFFEQEVMIQVEDISKIDVIAFASIHSITKQKFEIVKSIGAMINSGGGLILFGCRQQNSSIIAHGQTVSFLQKRNFQEELESCLSCFHPTISFKDNVELKFIPITKRQYAKFPCERQYIKGMFVTVLQMCTNYPEQTVFSLIQNQKIIFIRKKGKTIQLKGQECHKYIKAKFCKKYITQQEKMFISHHHRNKRISLYLDQDNTRIQQKYNPYKPILDSYRLQQRFDYVSAVFLHGCNLRNVTNHLTLKNIRNFKFYAFSKSIVKNNKEIKIQKEPILLFHMTTPKKLKEIFESCPTTGDSNQHVELKNITNSIKLNRRLLKEQFDEALKFLRQKKQTEYLIYYQLIDKEAFYLQTGSKVSFFYLYGYLKEIGFNRLKFRYIEDFTQIEGMRKKFSSSQPS